MTFPKGVRDIIDLFISVNFNPLTYNQIAAALHAKPNTIIQRIKRTEGEYFTITGKRPYKISVTPGIPEIIFYRDKNQCQLCRKTVNPKRLTLRYKNPNLKDKDEWSNCFSCCEECLTKDVTKKFGPKSKKIQRGKKIRRPTWEYHEVNIRKVVKYPEMGLAGSVLGDLMGGLLQNNLEEYYEFDELNGEGWYSLMDDDGKRTSEKLTDILDYFGAEGWELVRITELTSGGSQQNPWELSRMWATQIPSRNQEEYHCLFKRMKNGNDVNGK